MSPSRRVGWPSGLIELTTDPRDAAPRWAEHVQGATSAGGCWFVTQIDRIWRFPLDLDLAKADQDDPSVVEAGIPERGVDHLGDCDVAGDRLYVAMEGTTPARIGWYDLDLTFVRSAEVPQQAGSCPWCAVDPRDGLLYSSPFDTDHLCAYRPVHESGSFTLRHVGDVALRAGDGSHLHLERVQGGAFTDDGHLYLSSDASETATGGVHGIDVRTGRRVLHHAIRIDAGGSGGEVVEGLALHDLHDGPAPWLRGTLHVLALERRDDQTDRVWFRHYDFAGST